MRKQGTSHKLVQERYIFGEIIMNKLFFAVLMFFSAFAFSFETMNWQCTGSGFAISAITPDLGTTKSAAKAMQTLYTISQFNIITGSPDDVTPVAYFLTTSSKVVNKTTEVVNGKNAPGGSFKLTIAKITTDAHGADHGAGELSFKQGPISGDGIGLACTRD